MRQTEKAYINIIKKVVHLFTRTYTSVRCEAICLNIENEHVNIILCQKETQTHLLEKR